MSSLPPCNQLKLPLRLPYLASVSGHCPENCPRGQRTCLCVCSQTSASRLPAREPPGSRAIKGGICGKPQVNKVQAEGLGPALVPPPARWAGSERSPECGAGEVDKRLNEIQREAPWQGPPGWKPGTVIKLILGFVPTSAEARTEARAHSLGAPEVCHNYREKTSFRIYVTTTLQALKVGPKLLSFSRKCTIARLHLQPRVTAAAPSTCQSTGQELGSCPHFSEEAK